MSESAAEVIELLGFDAAPNPVPISAPLTVRITFAAKKPIAAARWVVIFDVDIASSRHRLRLLETTPADFPAGTHSSTLAIPTIDVTGVPPHALLNVGLLRCALEVGGAAAAELRAAKRAGEPRAVRAVAGVRAGDRGGRAAAGRPVVTDRRVGGEVGA